ncbi:MAG: nitroreductase family protein [Eubacteriales bacterium]|nr:nitroreductase family protein [Eubacteriales bacterium]
MDITLYDAITRRKSVRKYTNQPLSPDTLARIDQAIASFAPLYPDLPLRHRVVRQVKGKFSVEAPQYLIISGSGAAGDLENAGFVFEQLVLWLDAHELGSVWLGSSKDTDGEQEGDLLALAFGEAAEPVHREPSQFSRKPIEEITNSPDDLRIRSAHLAPSGLNIQPWRFEETPENILVYRQNLRAPFSMLYKLSDLDMGIALCHFALTCEKEGRPFSFTRTEDLPDKKGCTPFGILA